MERLQKLLTRFGRRGRGRHWVGPRPEGRIGQLPRLIASKVGYPTATEDPFLREDSLATVGRRRAAEILAYAATVSLVWETFKAPAKGVCDLALEGFADLGPNAVFLTSGRWPLTNATFEAGVLGYDARIAFIYWVEEED